MFLVLFQWRENNNNLMTLETLFLRPQGNLPKFFCEPKKHSKLHIFLPSHLECHDIPLVGNVYIAAFSPAIFCF